MKFGLLGSQISYSLSPFIHQFLLQEHAIEGGYQCIDISLEDFESIESKILNYTGINVTIPYKEKIQRLYPHASISSEVQSIGAVNCVHFKDGRVILHNTDAYGFIQPLRKYTHHISKKALILGNGGAMKAVKYALVHEYPTMDIHIAVRTKHNDNEIFYNEIEQLALSEYGLIINTTPISPYHFQSLSSETIMYDLNYREEKCQFLTDHPDTIHINGIAMLVYQAIRSFEIWNNCTVNQHIIEKLFKEIEVQYGIKQ